MPNLKIYVDRQLNDEQQGAIVGALPSLREMLSEKLQVDPSICQFSVVQVWGLEDAALVSAEIQLLPKADRTRDQLMTICQALKDELTNLVAVKTAVRATKLDPATYIVLR